jgi:hypothetical protein
VVGNIQTPLAKKLCELYLRVANLPWAKIAQPPRLSCLRVLVVGCLPQVLLVAYWWRIESHREADCMESLNLPGGLLEADCMKSLNLPRGLLEVDCIKSLNLPGGLLEADCIARQIENERALFVILCISFARGNIG